MVTLALLASLTATGYAAWHLILCYAAPMPRCRACHGTGERRGLIIRAPHECHRCHGTGRRPRLGRRLIEYIRTEYRAGHQ
ncbi:hypothetical protein ACGFIK_03465 [Micromonospora sp. NPDC048871]|uniref:hypothetical protein n=1 Tax=unclassified Micromonospora TaxID=2617518 RepID=UPI002E0DC40C|nr:hypothetical protein OIE53_17290 [Micromonospora sp. NBC_01739]